MSASGAAFWQGLALAMLALAGIANGAERLRARRRDPDRVGFMPWLLIMVLALVIAAFAGSIALRAAFSG